MCEGQKGENHLGLGPNQIQAWMCTWMRNRVHSFFVFFVQAVAETWKSAYPKKPLRPRDPFFTSASPHHYHRVRCFDHNNAFFLQFLRSSIIALQRFVIHISTHFVIASFHHQFQDSKIQNSIRSIIVWTNRRRNDIEDELEDLPDWTGIEYSIWFPITSSSSPSVLLICCEVACVYANRCDRFSEYFLLNSWWRTD